MNKLNRETRMLSRQDLSKGEGNYVNLKLELEILNITDTYDWEVKDYDEYTEEYYIVVDKIYSVGKVTSISKPFVVLCKFLG